MKSFCKDLKEHVTEITDYEKKEMIPLTIEESQSYHEQNICYIYAKKNSVLIIKVREVRLQKIRDHCHLTGKYRGAAHNIGNLR